jgi:hypothetical protein
MPTDWEKLINEEKARIIALDSTLDQKRTPCLKQDLSSALHRLGNTRDALSLGAKADSPIYKAAWLAIAEENIRGAAQMREKVQALVDAYGGPENVVETGG